MMKAYPHTEPARRAVDSLAFDPTALRPMLAPERSKPGWWQSEAGGTATRRLVRSLCIISALLLGVASLTEAAELTLKVADREPPPELDSSIRALLQTKAVQLLDGDKPAYEFWFVSQVPLNAKPHSTAHALESLKPVTLLGAVSISKPRRDYRDDEMAAGIYTVRFAHQPHDGNHLGTAEFHWFAVLVPAALDTRPDGISEYKPLVKASSKQTSTDHPVILSLRPASSDQGKFPRLNEPAPEHKSVVVQLPAVAGAEKVGLVFEMVYEGVGKK